MKRPQQHWTPAILIRIMLGHRKRPDSRCLLAVAQAAFLMRLAENLQEKLECSDFQLNLESTYAVEVDSCFVFVVLSCDFTRMNNGMVLRYIECGMVLSGHSILFRFTYLSTASYPCPCRKTDALCRGQVKEVSWVWGCFPVFPHSSGWFLMPVFRRCSVVWSTGTYGYAVDSVFDHNIP